MMNVDLPAVARILYFLIDDKCNENGEMWWHWRKMALAIGVGRTRFFEAVEYLKSQVFWSPGAMDTASTTA